MLLLQGVQNPQNVSMHFTKRVHTCEVPGGRDVVHEVSLHATSLELDLGT